MFLCKFLLTVCDALLAASVMQVHLCSVSPNNAQDKLGVLDWCL